MLRFSFSVSRTCLPPPSLSLCRSHFPSLSVRVCVFDFVDVAASIKRPTLPSAGKNWKLALKRDVNSSVQPL